MKLYTYYRSQASFRVRIALNLKGIAREDSFLHLEKGDQLAAEYRAINPQMVVPTLIDSDVKLFQSLAILEYLDEKYREPPLLPSDPVARAWVRGFALINAADSHPLIVPRVRHYLVDVLKVSEEQRLAWIQHWLGAGLEAMEALLDKHTGSGRFCYGDGPTMADICLVTQVTPAKTFNCALDPYPRVMCIYDTCTRQPIDLRAGFDALRRRYSRSSAPIRSAAMSSSSAASAVSGEDPSTPPCPAEHPWPRATRSNCWSIGGATLTAQHRVSEYDVMLSCFGVWLYRLGKKDRDMLETTIAGSLPKPT